MAATKKKAATKSAAPVRVKKAPATRSAAAKVVKQRFARAEYSTRVQALVAAFSLLSVIFAIMAYMQYYST